MVGVDCMVYLEYQLDLTMSHFFQVTSYEVVEGVAEVARVKQEVVQEVVQGVIQEVVQGAEGVTEECQTPGEGGIIRDHTPTNRVKLAMTRMEVPLTIQRRITLHIMPILIILTTSITSPGQF